MLLRLVLRCGPECVSIDICRGSKVQMEEGSSIRNPGLLSVIGNVRGTCLRPHMPRLWHPGDLPELLCWELWRNLDGTWGTGQSCTA